jgi:hypothetical protein
MPKELKEASKLFQPVFLISFIPVLILLIFLLITGIKKDDIIDVALCSVGLLVNISVLCILQLPKLTLIIDRNGIQFKYRPYHKNTIHYAWDDINAIEVIKFDAVNEFKGWGRKSSTRYGTGYLTLGGDGIHITDKNANSVTLTVIDIKAAENLISLYAPLNV